MNSHVVISKYLHRDSISRGKGIPGVLEHIPQILAVSLIVTVVGGTVLFYLRGYQAAESLNMSFTYSTVEYETCITALNKTDQVLEMCDKIFTEGAEDQERTAEVCRLLDETEGIGELRTEIRNCTDMIGRQLSADKISVAEIREAVGEITDQAEGILTEWKKVKAVSSVYKLLRADVKWMKKNILQVSDNAISEDVLKSLSGKMSTLSDELQGNQERITSYLESLKDLADWISEVQRISDTDYQGLREDNEKIIEELGEISQRIIDYPDLESTGVKIVQEKFTEDICSLKEELDGFREDLVNYIGQREDEILARTHNLDARNRMSRDIDEGSTDQSDVADTYTESGTALCGSITSADGVYLWGPLVTDVNDIDPAWTTLIGNAEYTTGANGFSRYLVDCYKETLLGDVSYSPLSGFSMQKADMTLTISDKVQQGMYKYMEEQSIEGCVFSVDYESGEVSCMASSPSGTTSQSPINLCMYNTSPGSCMKLITILLLMDQSADIVKKVNEKYGTNYKSISDITFTCSGSYILKADNNKITCTDSKEHYIVHGRETMSTALSDSCNCWFAQAIELLDLTRARELLKELGYDILGKNGYLAAEDSGITSIGELRRSTSWIQLGSKADYNTVWNLIGETSVRMSPIDVAELAGIYASGGKSQAADMIQGETTETPAVEYAKSHPELFQAAAAEWKAGYKKKAAEEDSEYSKLNSLISMAKTGTTEIAVNGENGSNQDAQRLLTGCSEKLHTAFFICIENYRVTNQNNQNREAEATVIDTANRLIELLQED